MSHKASELPDLLRISGLTARWVSGENHNFGLLFQFVNIMAFPFSLDDRCQHLWHFSLTFIASGTAKLLRTISFIRLLSSLSHMLSVLHQKGCEDPEMRQSKTRFYVWHRRLGLRWCRPFRICTHEHNGCLLKSRQTWACFPDIFNLSF